MRKIITIITIATMLFTLAACSKGKTEKTASPSDTVIECFYLISHDKVSDLPSLCEADKVEFPYPSETINALFENDETKEMIAEMEKDIDLEVYNSDEKEDKATVKFKTTSYDFGSLVNDTYNDYLEWLTENMLSEISEEETKKESISIFKNNIKELKKDNEQDLSIELVLDKNDNKWYISQDTDFEKISEAIFGGPIKAISALDDTEDTTSEEKPNRDLPEKNYKDVGDGKFYLRGASGSTENGDEIIVYPDKESMPMAYVDVELWDMNGKLLTYMYIDGVEVDKKQVGAGYQSSLDLSKDWQVKDGKHKVEIVQYKDNDAKSDIVFYRSEEYTIKEA